MELKEGMTCPACDTGNLIAEYRDLEWSYKKKHKMVFLNSKIFYCDHCPEEFLDVETNKSIELWISHIRKGEE